jgi:hypothetical protein
MGGQEKMSNVEGDIYAAYFLLSGAKITVSKYDVLNLRNKTIFFAYF